MLTTNQLARKSGVASHVVRFEARVGLVRSGRRRGNGYRLFDRSEVVRLGFIHFRVVNKTSRVTESTIAPRWCQRAALRCKRPASPKIAQTRLQLLRSMGTGRSCFAGEVKPWIKTCL
jgi:hypothetical protein